MFWATWNHETHLKWLLLVNGKECWYVRQLFYAFTWVEVFFPPRRIGLVLFTVLVSGNNVRLTSRRRGPQRQQTNRQAGRSAYIKAPPLYGRLSLKRKLKWSSDKRLESKTHTAEWNENIWISHWTPLWIRLKVQTDDLVGHSTVPLFWRLCSVFDRFGLQ